MSTAISSSPASAVVWPGPDEEVGDRHLTRAGGGLERGRRVEADERSAGLHGRRGIHHVAADRPLGARCVRADDRRGVGERGEALADHRVGDDLLVGRRARRGGAPPPEPVMPRSDSIGVDRDEAVRKRSLALTRADDEIGATGDDAGAAAQRRERLLDGGGGDVRRSSVASSARSPDPLGRHRQLTYLRPDHLGDRVRDRARCRHARRLADALRALRARVLGRRLDPGDLDLAARRPTSRACSRAGAGCAACPSSSNCVPSVSAWPMPITTPP